MTEQGDRIVDYVFPIVDVELLEGGDVRAVRFMGTGFFIGSHSFALTAKHVMKGASTPAILMRAEDQSWRVFGITDEDSHPTEDISLIRINSRPEGHWRSQFVLPGSWSGSGMPYFLFGYPESALYELGENGPTLMRPDMIYSEGHVRRRLTDVPLLKVPGSRFLELSQVAGPGCSGSPVLHKQGGSLPWKLIGVYVGERLDSYSTSVGYAVRLNEIRDWQPDSLSRSLDEEANDISE